MKTITIGRGPENTVTLDDPKISRHHALLRCYPFGKMEIVDLSQNGTFVNGMRIPSNKPYPLTRKDIVTFAHAEKLDWKQVPVPYRRIKLLVLWAIAMFAVILIGSYFYSKHSGLGTGIEDSPQVGIPESSSRGFTPVDSIKRGDNKSDKRFVFPQTKSNNNSKGEKKEINIDTTKTQKTEKDGLPNDVLPKKEDTLEQSVLL